MKKAYEWVIVFFKDDEDLYLTERQYEYYKEHISDKVIFFDNFSITPSGVVKTYKQEADHIKSMYPCRECSSNGIIIMKKHPDGSFPICPKCEGSGVDL